MLESYLAPHISGPMARTAPLLATKLHAPAVRPNLVSRPRLLARLDGALAARLTLVSAPAGAGKTTLLSDWLSHRSCLSAWVSLDVADSDPARFFSYVMAAVEGAVPGSAAPAQLLLGPAHPPPLEPVLTLWLNGLCALDRHLVLVLDDYHLIDAPAVHGAMGFLLDRLPPKLHVVIATRVDPALPLAKLRGRGQLLEVRGSDLRFTCDEAAAFLEQTMGLALSPEDIATLEARTEGWIAGLQMAALSMQGRSDVSALAKAFSGSHHYVLDYLAEEVLERQPQEVQEFLLHTCILERLTAPLCQAVTGRPGAQAMLEGLERRNLFVVALDDARQWYRYHQLFADLLRSRLRQVAPELEPVLALRAADWCEGNGLLSEAMQYAGQAQDFERAARLAEGQADATYLAGQCDQLLAQVNRLPVDVRARCPRLCAYAALRRLYSSGDVGEAEALVRLAEAAAHECAPGPQARDLLGMVAAVRSVGADLEGDMARVERLARQAQADLAEANPLRAVVGFTLGDMAYQCGDLEGAEREWREVRHLGLALGAAGIAASATRALMLVEEARGRLGAALALGQEALALARGRPELEREAGNIGIGLARIHYELNDLDAAERLLHEAIRAIEPGGVSDATVAAYTTLARVRMARRDAAGAAEALDSAEQGLKAVRVTSDIEAELAACQVRLWLAQSRVPGNPPSAAVRWVAERSARRGDRPGWAEELEQISVARVRLAQGRSREAAELLAGLAAAAEAGGHGGRLVEVLALQALALRVQGQVGPALAALRRALALAEPQGYARVFLDEGPAMVALLRELGDLGEPRELMGYVERLLAHGEQAGPPEPAAPLIEALSARELEVLRLAAAGLSNREIADRLIVTVGTVKTHLHNVYTKLGATSRTQAIARARSLHLV